MKILNKSQVNTFLDCPFKWHKIYIEGIKSEPSPAQERGIRIHSKIEKFYHNLLPDLELKQFINFELKRLKAIKKENKLKYFKPIFQELRMKNEKIGLKGTCDAVYINPEDDELIVIDYKSGKFRPKEYEHYRFELALYAELLNHSGKVNEKVKYIGILFADQEKLFFEELTQETIDKMYKIVNKAREDMEKYIKENNFPATKNTWCFNCQFKKECPLFKK